MWFGGYCGCLWVVMVGWVSEVRWGGGSERAVGRKRGRGRRVRQGTGGEKEGVRQRAREGERGRERKGG